MSSEKQEQLFDVLDAFSDYLAGSPNVKAERRENGTVHVIIFDRIEYPKAALPKDVVKAERVIPVASDTYSDPEALAKALWYEELTDTWVELGIGKTNVNTEDNFRQLHLAYVGEKAEHREEELYTIAGLRVELSPDAATE